MKSPKGGYHLEKKGISNYYADALWHSIGGYYLEMKGISNMRPSWFLS